MIGLEIIIRKVSSMFVKQRGNGNSRNQKQKSTSKASHNKKQEIRELTVRVTALRQIA
jgi:hypothetical protein